MENSFSMDVVPNPMWTLQTPMQPQVDGDCGGVVTCEDTTGCDTTDLSPSEWSFERLLEEELMKNTTPADSSDSVFHIEPVSDVVEVEPPTVTMGETIDPIEYNAILKRKLEEDLAAIAMWRASSTVHPENSHGPYAYNGGSTNLAQNKFRDGREHHVHNTYNCSKFPASSSSMEPLLSDDDDMDGEVEILGFRIPETDKMKKRKESNRESARRSRTRRAAHMKDLEDQVTHLRVENSLLLRRLDAIKQKYNASAVDNRILRADMETLRTKVKMAEDTMNRLIAASSPSFSGMPFVGSPSYAAPPDPSVPIIQDNNNISDSYYATAPNAAMVSDSYMPMAAADPSPLQAEVVVNESSNTRKIDQIAVLHCAMDLEELLQESLNVMPNSSGGEAAPWELFTPLGVDEINNVDLEEVLGLENMDILG